MVFLHRYTFLNVLPGNYDITASHPSWTLVQVGTFTSDFIRPYQQHRLCRGADSET